MAHWIDRLATYEARRRTMFKLGGAAGVLLAAGVPSLAFADNGQGNQDGQGNGQGVGQQKGKLQNIPVTGSVTSGAGGSFAGTFSIGKFVQQNGQVVALGTLAGALTDGSGNALGTLSNVPASAPLALPGAAPAGAAAPAAAAPAQATTASCTILHLVLGPINLNLLGLVITTNQIVVDITAVPGPGNLLGNLLCDIANLLNGGSLSTLLQQLVADLNNLLAALGL